MREQYQEEFIKSIILGGIIAAALTAALPGIDSRGEAVLMMILFWFLGTVAVWELIVMEEAIERYVHDRSL